MHPDPPDDRLLRWKIELHEVDTSRKDSFDDQYLNELKALRDPNFVPETKMNQLLPVVLNGRIYPPGLWDSIQEQLNGIQ